MSKFKYKSAKNLYDNYISKTNENELLIKGKKDIYSISDTLGKGAFGKVIAYSIIRNPQKKFACKILDQLNMIEKDDKKRCQREMTILLQMNHPNVIKTTEIISDSYRYYIIMEYCQKGELFNHIVEQQHFTEEKSAFYYYQLISGVDYIHSKNICHRDLKPENLLLNEENELKIIDFGLSNFFLGENKLLITPCGSPCYASPEMILGNNYNGFSIDVWSSGIILYAMLCGYLPFEEGERDINNELLFRNIVECKVEYPEEFISPVAKDLLKKIIVREPKKRITIKQIKNHPFFLMGKDIYMKKFGERKNNSNYNYGTFRHFPTMNFNDMDLNYKYFDNKENNDYYINVNKKNKICPSLNIDYDRNCTNFNDIYLKTNYERKNNYLNLLENDIFTYKFLNNSFGNDNNDINVDKEEKNKNKSHSVNNKINTNNYNKPSNNHSYTRNKNMIFNNKKTMTLDTKINNNNEIMKMFDEKIMFKKTNKTIKDSNRNLNYQQNNLLTLNNKESNLLNNYLETNYNNISNYNNENDINVQYMKTDINFTNMKFKNKNNKSQRNYINKKKYEESSKYMNANINNYFKNKNSKKKEPFKSTFRKEKNDKTQISLHKGLVFNNQKHPLTRNRKNNNSIKKAYNNFLDKNESPNNNNQKNKYSVDVRNYSKNNKNKNSRSKTNKMNHNKTNSYSSYINNAINKKNNISKERYSFSPKFINEYRDIKTILTENNQIPMTINNIPYPFKNGLKQNIKYSTNRRNNNLTENTINNKIITSNNNQKKQKSKINYNLTSTIFGKNKIKNKTNKNSSTNLSLNTKENYYTSRPKSQKQKIIKSKNKLNNYNYNKDKKLINNGLYNDEFINIINNKKKVYNENIKNNLNEDNNRIIINLNILKQKILFENDKKNIKKNKYSSSLIKTYNNIDINTNNKNNIKKKSFTQKIFKI